MGLHDLVDDIVDAKLSLPAGGSAAAGGGRADCGEGFHALHYRAGRRAGEDMPELCNPPATRSHRSVNQIAGPPRPPEDGSAGSIRRFPTAATVSSSRPVTTSAAAAS